MAQEIIAYSQIDQEGNLTIITDSSKIITIKEDQQRILNILNMALINKEECRISFNERTMGETGAREYMPCKIWIGEQTIYAKNDNFRDSLKVKTSSDGKAGLPNRGNTNNNSSENLPVK